MQKITPFFWFDTQAEEAVNFYVSIFSNSPVKKGESRVISIKRYPKEQLDGPPPGMEGKVLTAVFELGGNQFMALDGGPYFKPTGAISFYIECDSQEEVDHFWNHLGEGGDPANQQCGWLTDKYGFSWQIVPTALPQLLNDPDKEKSMRAMKAMLQMKKLDIAELERAFAS